MLRSLLTPSRDIAPAYRPWQITLTDGEQRIGLPLQKGGRRERYRAANGETFSIPKRRIASHRELSQSLMPSGLAETLTPRELRDLLALLESP